VSGSTHDSPLTSTAAIVDLACTRIAVNEVTTDQGLSRGSRAHPHDGHVAMTETDPVTVTTMPITPSHHAFGEVAALFDDYRTHYGRRLGPEFACDWLHDQLAQRTMKIAAAIHADQVCGFITTSVMPASLMLGTAWSIRDLYVAPQHRRSGVARTLLQRVIDDARVAGACRVSLQTETDNAPALRLYAAAGFQAVSGLELLNLTLIPADHQDS
jgi:ribosomal protein S18 acetylase RimI-like enzyme